MLAVELRGGKLSTSDVNEQVATKDSVSGSRRMLAPLALAQFIASFAGSNMNVAITDISHDLDTTVHGVQTAITLFLLTMAALMIPGSKLSDRWGRKRWTMSRRERARSA
jgi:predicted MFS family arabinose efflux permease